MVLVGLQVRRPILPAAKDTIARLAPPASDASVAPDAGRLAADLPPRCPEVVRDFRLSASADATEPKAVRPCQTLPLLDVLQMAVCLAQNADVFPPPVAAPVLRFESELGRQVV